MNEAPSTNGTNGRDGRGRFASGNPGGPGNPHAAKVGDWRSALARTVTTTDLCAVVAVLVERAKAGEPWAVRELLDRTLGRPLSTLELYALGEQPERVPIRIYFGSSGDAQLPELPRTTTKE